jgi:hypothetical protein
MTQFVFAYHESSLKMLHSLNTAFDYSTVLKYITHNVVWGMQLVYMIAYAITNR